MTKGRGAVAPKTITTHRSAVTGKFVTKGYTERHPHTTETERYRLTPRGMVKPRGKP